MKFRFVCSVVLMAMAAIHPCYSEEEPVDGEVAEKTFSSAEGSFYLAGGLLNDFLGGQVGLLGERFGVDGGYGISEGNDDGFGESLQETKAELNAFLIFPFNENIAGILGGGLVRQTATLELYNGEELDADAMGFSVFIGGYIKFNEHLGISGRLGAQSIDDLEFDTNNNGIADAWVEPASAYGQLMVCLFF